MNADFIKNNFSYLADGASASGRDEELCACGREKDCKLGVKREGDTLLYNCFRPSCELGGGRVKARLRHNAPKQPVQRFEPAKVALPTTYIPHVPEKAFEWLKQYGVTRAEIKQYQIGYDTETGRIVMTVFNEGVLTTYNARCFDDSHPVKVLTPKGAPRCATFFTGTAGETRAIVEDILSAIRLERYGVPACAILGTNPPDERLTRVARWLRGVKEVFFILDDDANDKALQLQHRLRKFGVFAKCVLTRKGKDPKLMTDEELKELLK